MKLIYSAVFALALFVIGILVFFQADNYKSDNKEEQERVRNTRKVTGCILAIIGGIVGLIFIWYYFKRKDLLAEDLLKETDPKQFSSMCDQLFEITASKPVLDNYKSMKVERSQQEVANLCGNYAKTILHRK